MVLCHNFENQYKNISWQVRLLTFLARRTAVEVLTLTISLSISTFATANIDASFKTNVNNNKS